MLDKFPRALHGLVRVLGALRTDPVNALVVLGMIIALCVVLWLLWGAQHAEEDWEAFVLKNDCVRLSDIERNSRPGWRCADGKVHYRWRQQL